MHEEDRLSRHGELTNASSASNDPLATNSSTPQCRHGRVRFASTVLVTEIPCLPHLVLPKPVTSPMGKPLSPPDVEEEHTEPDTNGHQVMVPFSSLSDDYFDSVGHLTDDADFEPHPSRRKQPPSDPSASDGPSTATRQKRRQNASSKRPRGEQNGCVEKRGNEQHVVNCCSTPMLDATANGASDPDCKQLNSPDDERRLCRGKRKRPTESDCARKVLKVGNASTPTSDCLQEGDDHGNGVANGANGRAAHIEENKSDNEATDLDDMFGDLVKRKAAKRADVEKKMKEVEAMGNNEKGLKGGDEVNSAKGKKNGKTKAKRSATRLTEDGLRILTYDDIAADQPPGLNGDCPFDCSCCF